MKNNDTASENPDWFDIAVYEMGPAFQALIPVFGMAQKLGDKMRAENYLRHDPCINTGDQRRFVIREAQLILDSLDHKSLGKPVLLPYQCAGIELSWGKYSVLFVKANPKARVYGKSKKKTLYFDPAAQAMEDGQNLVPQTRLVLLYDLDKEGLVTRFELVVGTPSTEFVPFAGQLFPAFSHDFLSLAPEEETFNFDEAWEQNDEFGSGSDSAEN